MDWTAFRPLEGTVAEAVARVAEAHPHLHPEGIRGRVRRLRARAESERSAPPRSVEMRGTADGAEVSGLVPGPIRTLDDLANACGVDLDAWQIVSWSAKAWQGYAKDSADEIQTVQLYAVRATLKPATGVGYRAEAMALLDEVRRHAPRIPKRKAPARLSTGLALELSIPDLHLGKLAWAPETGDSYDVGIAREMFERALDDLLAKAPAEDYSRIVLVVGNDLLQSDNSRGTTTSGTQVDCDGRHQRTFRAARQMIQAAIEERLLALSDDVRVVMVPGNHDRESVWYLGETLDAWCSRTPEVTVDNSPRLRKYVEFGANLIGYTHGCDERHSSLPLIMATEEPGAWARTKYREWHLGHLHTRKATAWQSVGEHHGVVTRILPSLSGADAWHHSKGYVGNVRSAEAYVWHEEDGLVGTAVHYAR